MSGYLHTSAATRAKPSRRAGTPARTANVAAGLITGRTPDGEPEHRTGGSMNLLPGVRSHTIATDRLQMHYIESGPADGIPVVLIHGNLATGRFYEHLLPGAP